MSMKHLRLLALTTLAATFVWLTDASARATASSYTFRTLHNFCKSFQCSDGANPSGGMVMDQAGHLYGATANGGWGCYPYGPCYGLIFKLALVSGRWKETVLYTFGHDGIENPEGDLIIDKDGNLYGVTQTSDYNDYNGAVYKLTHGSKGWSISTLFLFNGKNGDEPLAGLTYAGQSSGKPWDESSPLFGTTFDGGYYGNGVAYELDAKGNFSVIHNFQSSAHPNALLEDSSGDLYGTTQSGGKYGYGLMFKLEHGTWKEILLHSFCSQANCADGGSPIGRLAMDGSGNLFGTASTGGSGTSANCQGCGVVFERTAGGTYDVLYAFCPTADCPDGGTPLAGLTLDGSGNMYGTTSEYAGYGAGGVFELTQTSGVWSESAIHAFGNGQDYGSNARSSLLLDSAGDIFGTTAGTGQAAHMAGNAFKLTPSLR